MFVHILAARPNFIKANSIIAELNKRGFKNILVHTNQHYDYLMSKVFFEQLDIPEPDYHLSVGSGTHAKQTADALVKIEEVLIKEKPKYVIVYGDVNSTLSGALAAAKLGIKVIHVEAGSRSGDIKMPEEINRLSVDSFSTLYTCTEPSAYTQLTDRLIPEERICLAGNTALDALYTSSINGKKIKPYYLATFHRPFNVDNPVKLETILDKINSFKHKVIIPAHPRLKKNTLKEYNNIDFIDPLGFNEFISYIKYSEGVITDSGGIQCEASFFHKPTLTVRPSTEHKITLDLYNRLVEPEDIKEDLLTKVEKKSIPNLWDGNAGKRVAEFILNYDSQNS
mgnify:CR=1 FL=1